MRQHRRTAKTVPNIPSLDNSAASAAVDDSDPFDPAEALEALHTEIIQLEAFAHAAGEAVTRLPHTADPKHRRDLTRIYALVSKSPPTPQLRLLTATISSPPSLLTSTPATPAAIPTTSTRNAEEPSRTSEESVTLASHGRT